MNIDNCKFLFYLTGKCFLSKETNAKYLYVKHFKNMLCYQGWDKNTPYLNASKRKTFSLPVGQYVSAFNFYNNRNPNNPHTPTLVIKINGNATIVTIEDVMIKANKDSEQEFILKINDNYETYATKRNLSLDGSSMKLEDIENSNQLETMNVVCELMISAMSYKYLNHDKYLSNLQVPFSKNDYDNRYNVFGGFFSNTGKGHINLNFLLEDECDITKEGDDYILSIKKNLCGFQIWHDKNVALNKSKTRYVFNVLPTQFQSYIHQHGTMIEDFGFDQSEMGFQPTCILKLDNGNKLFIGVIKDMEIDHSFQGFESGGNVSTNKIRLSTVQTSGNLGGSKNDMELRENELPQGKHFISMNIDATDLPIGTTSSTKSSNSSNFFVDSPSNNRESYNSPVSNPNQSQVDQIKNLVDDLVSKYGDSDTSDISNDDSYLNAGDWATLIQLAYTVSVATGTSMYKEYLSDIIKCLYTQLEGNLCKEEKSEDSTDNQVIVSPLVSQDDGDIDSTGDIILEDLKKYGLGIGNFVALDAGFKFVHFLFGKTKKGLAGFLKSIKKPLNATWKNFLQDNPVGRLLSKEGVNYELFQSDFEGAGEAASEFVSNFFSAIDPNGEFQKSVSQAKETANKLRTEFRVKNGYPSEGATEEEITEWNEKGAIDEDGNPVLDENEKPISNGEYERAQYKKNVAKNLDSEVVDVFKENANKLATELETNEQLASEFGEEATNTIKSYAKFQAQSGTAIASEVVTGVEEIGESVAEGARALEFMEDVIKLVPK